MMFWRETNRSVIVGVCGGGVGGGSIAMKTPVKGKLFKQKIIIKLQRK
jgi:hypothetical protein